MDWSLVLVLVVSSFGTASVALLIMGAFLPKRQVSWEPFDTLGDRLVFLFEDTRLVDATPIAHDFLDQGPRRLDDWPQLVSLLNSRFPEFEAAMSGLGREESISLKSVSDGARIHAEWRAGVARITLIENAEPSASQSPDQFSIAAMTDELATLRQSVQDAPILSWKEDRDGNVRWANGLYIDLVNRASPSDEAPGWPLRRIFDQSTFEPELEKTPRRLSVTLPGETDPSWFECYFETVNDETLYFGIPADKLVQAEASLREFVQTLTKTFAHLTTGLAVFDRDRRLALFNPALTDLSALEPMFLSSRPSLMEFLDQLREKQRMPEPKNYKSWRRDMAELEIAAASGTYQETWSLPTGQTYRVTGRPHPDGAVAFLFEDISAEISLTRRFRSELELGQAVIDSFEDALAVFSASGTLIMSNAAYDRMWNCESSTTLGEISATDATRTWQGKCRPTPIWGDFRDYIARQSERVEWEGHAELLDGRLLSCRFSPVTGHATLVRFAEEPLREIRNSKIWTQRKIETTVP